MIGSVIGEHSCGVIGKAFPQQSGGNGGDGTTVYALRRTEAHGRWIGWHTDTARCTVQVPLSDDDTCEGGLLLFARADGTIVHTKRRAGTVLAHDGRLVHGVTKLVRGVRYGLFVLRWVDE